MISHKGEQMFTTILTFKKKIAESRTKGSGRSNQH